MINDPPFSFLLNKTKVGHFQFIIICVFVCLVVYFWRATIEVLLYFFFLQIYKYIFCKLYFANMNVFFDICTKETMLWRCVHITTYYWCLFMCRARWSDLEKLRSHWTHLKGLRPVCLRWCRVNSSDLANLHSHPSQEQRYGFSPATEIK